ncbi:MAG: hypothetical protein MAG795_00005 [Candidatus Woesearchaeota archaeon]|nr:hypothetical protein [Candidatus Woesearchaeota archaeon]
MPTTTELTEQYIKQHPSIKDSLIKGIVNYSKLSRRIAKELDIEKKTSMEAILIACRRYEQKIQKQKPLENKIIKIFKQSELEIKTKIVVVIIEKGKYSKKLTQVEEKIRNSADLFYAIEGTKAMTLVISEKNLSELKKIFKKHIKKITKNWAMIIIKSPEEIETTPGSMAYLYSLFADRGINIGHTMSCWTDTMLLIKEQDVAKAMEFLSF